MYKPFIFWAALPKKVLALELRLNAGDYGRRRASDWVACKLNVDSFWLLHVSGRMPGIHVSFFGSAYASTETTDIATFSMSRLSFEVTGTVRERGAYRRISNAHIED